MNIWGPIKIQHSVEQKPHERNVSTFPVNPKTLRNYKHKKKPQEKTIKSIKFPIQIQKLCKKVLFPSNTKDQ